eukprot:Phypoly_transcript_03067.p1 GENE.Phypoly_transcript_03067~~Phypoly_transcript_03067.p1  ORF type:complete len:822 (+),score=139.06 Phypoly_transcript_03067:68-2533(+)
MRYLVLRRHYSTAEPARKITQQHHLGAALQQLFPDYAVRENVRKEGSIQFPSTLNFLEIDFWVPELRLAFEFQDVHHYKQELIVQKSLEYVSTRDDFKKATLVDRGETLIHVPYWWDGSLESLAATIQLHRDDILLEHPIGSPISNQPPFSYHVKGSVPDVGDLMLASVPDAPILDPEKWWVSEKYDGIRGCWNPRTSTIYARSGGEIIVPQFFVKQLPPDTFVDFEFWSGKGSFDEAAKAVYLASRVKARELFELTQEEKRDIEGKAREMSEWNFLRILIFDCPAPALADLPFQARLTELLAVINSSHPFLVFIPHFLSKSRKHLESTLEGILQDGGEGIVLRKVNSTYIPGRSDMMYKLKMTRDQEALLVYVDTQDNMYRVQFPEGATVLAPIPPHLENSDVKPGDILTVRVEIYKEHVPAQVVVMRVRRDMTWHDVVANYKPAQASDKPDLSGPTSLRGLKEPNTRKPAGHWQVEDAANVRKQLDEFAKKRGLDPLVPETWYDIPTSDIHKECGSAFMSNYNRSFIRSLVAVYPNIGLKLCRFKRKPGSFWNSLENQRAYLDDYAARNGFDPLIPKNWRDFSVKKLRDHDGYSLISKWNNSPFQALRGVYPDVKFKASDFYTVPKKYWDNAENRKKAFDQFAASRGFDPLVTENWYPIIASLSDEKSKSAMESLPIITLYGGSFQTALIDVYPNLSFVPIKFARLPRHYWKNRENLRNFMLNIAQKHNFDPLLPQVWLSRGYKCIMQEKHGHSVISHFGSVARVIQTAFPEMGIENVATRVRLKADAKTQFIRSKDGRFRAHGVDSMHVVHNQHSTVP